MGDHQQWKWINGFNKYAISNDGVVVRKSEISIRNNKPVIRFGSSLKFDTTRDGYKIAHLYVFDGKKTKKCIPVHRLVAEHFIQNVHNKPQVNHINGVKNDNRVENLEWVTRKENQRHAVNNGLYKDQRGEKHNLAKLTEAQALEIKFGNSGLSGRQLALKYGVCTANINRIIAGSAWKHLKQ